MKQRRVTKRPDAGGGNHRITLDRRLRATHVPSRVNNVSAPNAFPRRRIEAIALGQKIIERAGRGVVRIANRPVAPANAAGLPASDQRSLTYSMSPPLRTMLIEARKYGR